MLPNKEITFSVRPDMEPLTNTKIINFNEMIKRCNYSKKSITFLILMILSPGLYAQGRIQDCILNKPKNGIYVVAHRGAHEGIPENSLSAYQKAIDLGCDFVEIDVRTTKDGKFVSIHNSTVDEYVTGIKAKVSELNLAELRSLDIGIITGPEWKNTRIPTFEEILEICHGKIGIYLDLKAAPITQLVDIIKKHGMEKEILWYISAADTKDINELKSSCTGCILMPDPGSGKNIYTTVNMLNVCVIATDVDQLSNEFVNIAHANNALVITDEKEGTESEWSKIIGWKTDGIQTDRPKELISFLKSHK
jgi:glycerophosphoryl diester phosphodiesterase